MRNLLKFLLKYYAVFLFVLLEFIAMLMIFQQNNYHNAIFINSTTGIIGSINKQINSITSYINLQTENENLQQENLRLRRMIEANSSSTPAYANTYIAGNVINKSVIKKKNYLTIDLGEIHGLKKQMGVIGPQGIVGIINNTSSHFASIIPVINTNFHVSAKLKKNNYFGSISWNGENMQLVNLTEIPTYIEISKGDTITTSGFSNSFPEGVLIGTVDSAKKSKANAFWEITVKLSTDFKTLDQVYIIEKALTKEQNDLEKKND